MPRGTSFPQLVASFGDGWVLTVDVGCCAVYVSSEYTSTCHALHNLRVAKKFVYVEWSTRIRTFCMFVYADQYTGCEFLGHRDEYLSYRSVSVCFAWRMYWGRIFVRRPDICVDNVLQRSAQTWHTTTVEPKSVEAPYDWRRDVWGRHSIQQVTTGCI